MLNYSLKIKQNEKTMPTFGLKHKESQSLLCLMFLTFHSHSPLDFHLPCFVWACKLHPNASSVLVIWYKPTLNPALLLLEAKVYAVRVWTRGRDWRWASRGVREQDFRWLKHRRRVTTDESDGLLFDCRSRTNPQLTCQLHAVASHMVSVSETIQWRD